MGDATDALGEFGHNADMAFGDFGFVLFELLLLGFAQSFPFEADLVLFAICRQSHQSVDELIKTAGRRHVVGFKADDDGIKTR